jgi:hypothetical protein
MRWSRAVRTTWIAIFLGTSRSWDWSGYSDPWASRARGGDRPGQGPGGGQEQLVADLARLRDDGAQPDPREDERVVGLADHAAPTRLGHRVARAAGSDQRSAASPGQDVGGKRLHA